jgi:hypothetical protein
MHAPPQIITAIGKHRRDAAFHAIAPLRRATTKWVEALIFVCLDPIPPERARA